jgi:hypothetical protein
VRLTFVLECLEYLDVAGSGITAASSSGLVTLSVCTAPMFGSSTRTTSRSIVVPREMLVQIFGMTFAKRDVLLWLRHLHEAGMTVPVAQCSSAWAAWRSCSSRRGRVRVAGQRSGGRAES